MLKGLDSGKEELQAYDIFVGGPEVEAPKELANRVNPSLIIGVEAGSQLTWGFNFC